MKKVLFILVTVALTQYDPCAEMLNSKEKPEHFASLSAGYASQQKLNGVVGAGKIIKN